jgi:hypothetical protein
MDIFGMWSWHILRYISVIYFQESKEAMESRTTIVCIPGEIRKLCIPNVNNIVNGVLRDVVYRVYQGVL